MLNTDFSYDLTEGTLSRYIVEGDGYSRDICYSYDGFGRTSSVTRSLTEFDGTGSIGQNIAYGYIQTSDPDDGTITYNRIGSVTNEYTVTADDETTTVASETFTYTYDASGNITEIKNNGSTLFRYHYDLLDQLTREDNAQSGRTYVYEYDNAGNIKSKKTYGYTTAATVSTTLYSTQTYGYGSGISGDILTSLNGGSITYDGTLSPLNYVLSGDDCALTWTQGRRLSHIISDDGSREYSYTYNADGIRTSKTVNGVEHIYHLSGTRILDEEWVSGSTRNLLIYIYDASGQPIGINYLKCVGNTVTKEAYLLGTNIQGDITCIYDTAGNRVVTYTYDAWGKILSVTGTAANTIGRYNPFRYRGYYYDNETGFYYLNSRYYDPSSGRFLNADVYINGNGDIIGFNLFAYCGNNPVMGYDPEGTINWGKFAKGVGRIIAGTTAAVAGALVMVAGAPVVMIVVAAITITAGVLTTVNGAADIQQSITGDNIVRDTVFNGNQTAYDIYSGATEAVANIGTIICGKYLSTYCTMKGAVPGTEGKVTLEPGTTLERYGSQYGRYLTDPGTPIDQLALTPGNSQNLTTYVVNRTFTFNTGIVATCEWGMGGGVQYFSWMSVKRLIQFGILTPLG